MSTEVALRNEAVPAPSRLRQLADPGLLRPFLEAKVQATFPKEKPTKAILVVYVDARAVASILDRVIGPESWSFQFQQSPMHTDQGWTAHGRLTVTDDFGRTIHREDLGTGSGNAEMGGKGCASDALKRCAAQLGVGRALYALEPITAPCDERKRVAPEQMQRAITAWRAQLEKWAAKFTAGDAGAEAPPAPMNDEMPTESPPSATPGSHGPPARGRHAGASANQSPASSAVGSGAPSAAGNQGPAGTSERPAPAGPSLSPGKAEFVALMGELGIRNTHGNRTRAVDALKAHKLASDDLVKPDKRAEAKKALRVAFGVKQLAEREVDVPSASAPGKNYSVRLRRSDDDTAAECECEWFKFHWACKHIPSAWLSLGLGMLASDNPIPSEPWDGISIEAVAAAAQEAYELSREEAKGKRSPEDEAADAAWEASKPKDAA